MKKVFNYISSAAVAAVVILAILLVGLRVFGLQVYTVLSGSMEPAYHTGSIIYVRKVAPEALKEKDVITFMLDENNIATHRIIEVIPDPEDSEVIRFKTKGDANDSADGGLVHCNNVIGTPVFTIPYLGFVANFVQHPPGTYITVFIVGILVLFAFLPDLLGKDRKQPPEECEDQSI